MTTDDYSLRFDSGFSATLKKIETAYGEYTTGLVPSYYGLVEVYYEPTKEGSTVLLEIILNGRVYRRTISSDREYKPRYLATYQNFFLYWTQKQNAGTASWIISQYSSPSLAAA